MEGGIRRREEDVIGMMVEGMEGGIRRRVIGMMVEGMKEKSDRDDGGG